MPIETWKNGTHFPAVEKSSLTKQFLCIKDFFAKLHELKKILASNNEELEWLSFPMSEEERFAAGLAKGEYESLITYKSKNHEINQIIPDDLNHFYQKKGTLKDNHLKWIYVVTDETRANEPICALKTNRKSVTDINTKHTVLRVLLHLRNRLKDKMSLQFLRLPTSVSKIENIDNRNELQECLLQESVMITDIENSASLWMKSRDQNFLILKKLFCNGKFVNIDNEIDDRLQIDDNSCLKEFMEGKKCRVQLGEPKYLPIIRETINARVSLGIPLIFQNNAIGVLCIWSKKYFHFLPMDIFAANTLATVAASCLENFHRINILQEIENITGRVLNARTNISRWLEDIDSTVGFNKNLTWSLHLKDPETGMIDAVAAHGRTDKKWERESRHHCTTDDIHAQIIRNHTAVIIRGRDERFDPFISKRYNDRDQMTSIIMPLYEKVVSAYELSDTSKQNGSSAIKKYKLSPPDSEAIGSLQIATKEDAFFSDEEFGRIFKTIQGKNDAFNTYTLRQALSLLPDTLRFFGKAQEAQLYFGATILKNEGPIFKSGQSSEDSIEIKFPFLSKDDNAYIKLKFAPSNKPSKMELLFIETFILILGRLLEAVYDRRISSNKGRFLQELSIAITEFHNFTDEESFIKQIAKTIIRYFYAEDVCFIKGAMSGSEGGDNKKNLKPTFMYRIAKNEKPIECPQNSCFLMDTKWIRNGSYSYSDLKKDNPILLNHFVGNISEDDRFIFHEIIKPSPSTDNQFLRMIVRLQPTMKKIVEQVDELLDLFNVSVGSVLKGYWKQELEKEKWMKRYTDMSKLSTDNIDELLERTINLLKGTNGYVGVIFFGYDDYGDKYFVYKMDGEENYFEPGQIPTRHKFKRRNVKGKDIYKDKNVLSRWIDKDSLNQPPFKYFPFRRDMDLLIVSPIQHRSIEGSIFNHFVVVRKAGEDDSGDLRFLAGLAIVLRDQIRRIEAKKIIEVRTKAEELFKVYVKDKDKLFTKLLDLLDTVAGPCLVAQYEGPQELDKTLKYSKQPEKLDKQKFLRNLPNTLYKYLLVKNFVRLKKNKLHNVINVTNEYQGWIFRLSPEISNKQLSDERFLLGVHRVEDKEIGLLPFDFNCIKQIVDAYDSILWHVKRVEEVTVRAAQVAHSVKSHFGGIIDHADLAIMILDDLIQKYPEAKKTKEVINRIHKTIASANNSIKAILNIQSLPDMTVNVDAFVRDTIIRFGREALQRGVFLEPKSLENMPILRVRGPAFDIIISNLIDNAIKYSWEERYVLVAGEKAPKHSEYEWVLIIQNYGEGIPANENEQIYESHNRGKARKRRSASYGMGMGLSTARTLAREMGMDITHSSYYTGSLDLEKSQVQRYLTTFKLWIPKKRVAN
ncbi:sensor histidine kinase [Desulfococcaceae bacterium HSG9]|nr:sensor histidine kinase [Desulfococcaceae bacterium HSG9]